jgi:hypothetical protein
MVHLQMMENGMGGFVDVAVVGFVEGEGVG